jgi:hypothetical protein
VIFVLKVEAAVKVENPHVEPLGVFFKNPTVARHLQRGLVTAAVLAKRSAESPPPLRPPPLLDSPEGLFTFNFQKPHAATQLASLF